MQVLRNKYAYVLTLVLAIQAFVYYSVAYRSEHAPFMAPLATFPHDLPGWQMTTEVQIEPDILNVLKADDTLERIYTNASDTASVSLFIGFFKTQRYGQNPHSPKNCLPGNGYEALKDTRITIQVPVWDRPITTNQYVVQRGDHRSVVLYGYQSHNRVIASEYRARMWLVADAIRYHRSDTSIVRIVVPVRENDVDGATRTGIEFIQAMFPALLKQLPA
jgi:EpsI family protein